MNFTVFSKEGFIVLFLYEPTSSLTIFEDCSLSYGIISSNAQECAGKSISGIISIESFFADV